MNAVISFLLALGCLAAMIQQNDTARTRRGYIVDDTIYWNKDRKLTWDDFNGMPDTNSIGGAATYSGFVTKSRYTSDTAISVVISAVFYQNRSWQKTQYQTARSLQHEQGHFDITEVFARKANIAFKAYRLNKATVSADINRIFNSFVAQKDSVQYLYDRETDNHRNVAQQNIWDKKIAGWLKTGR